MSRPCKAKSSRGSSCGGFAQEHSDYCYMHDPRRATDRHQARQLGGYNRRRTKGRAFLSANEVQTTRGLIKSIAALIEQTSRLEQSVKRDQALGQLMKIQSHLIIQSADESRARDHEREMERINEGINSVLHDAATLTCSLIQEEKERLNPQRANKEPSILSLSEA